MSTRDTRTCFVIMPFRKKKDPARRDEVDFDKVYTRIIQPAVEGLKTRGLPIKCTRSDKIEQAGSIHERMLRHIAESDVAVVDITALNANVFYELGVRHALCDRVTVLVRRAGTENPFNIGGMTTIEYDLQPPEVERARTAIGNYVFNGLLSGSTDSLVYSMLPGLQSSVAPKPINTSEVEEYAVPGTTNKTIGIVTGNLRNINLCSALIRHPISVWVSSENINMQMARSYESSISAMIRYLGAKKDATGGIVEDTIADALQRLMGKRQVVNPGEVVSTPSGCLVETHKVTRILHAAAVYGVVGTGFHPIAKVEQCITNALARADKDHRASDTKGGTSILFPLLGTGTARAEIIQSARKQMGAAVSYLQNRAEFTRIQRVYFLAPTDAHRSGMRVALAELGITDPVPRERLAAIAKGAPPRHARAAGKHGRRRQPAKRPRAGASR